MTATGTELHLCDTPECDEGSHLLPLAGVTVATINPDTMREVGGDDFYDLCAGARGVVVDSVAPFHQVYVKFTSQDPVLHVWADPENLRVIDPTVRDLEGSASCQHYIETGEYLPAATQED